jgi:hypothetical protein
MSLTKQSIILGIGTGRCGTASLAKILNQQPDAVCSFDEPPLLSVISFLSVYVRF